MAVLLIQSPKADHPSLMLYFFPRVILYNFFLFWLIYGGLGLGSYIGFLGLGFSVDGFGACGVGPSGFFGLGLFI